jgi:hypothetical protein
MSLVLAGSVAVSRDLAEPGRPIECPTRPALPSNLTQDPNPPTSTASFSHLIVAQIPSEALLAYTTLLALLSVSENGYHEARWAIYLVSLPMCGAVVLASYVRQRTYQPRRRPRSKARFPVPWLSITTTVIAMGIYGLTVPGSALQSAMSGTGFAITSGCLSVAGGLVMSTFTPFLGHGNRVTVPGTSSRRRPTGSVRPLRGDPRQSDASLGLAREDRSPTVRSVPGS